MASVKPGQPIERAAAQTPAETTEHKGRVQPRAASDTHVEAQDLVEAVGHEVGVVDRNAHRRLDAEHIAEQAPFTYQQATRLAKLEQFGGWW